MKIIAIILTIIFGAIYYPLNSLYLVTQKWYLPMWHKDKFIYFTFAPFYWILVVLVTIISVPYEEIVKHIH